MPIIGNPILSVGSTLTLAAAPGRMSVPAPLFLSTVPEQLDLLISGFEGGACRDAIRELDKFDASLRRTTSYVRHAANGTRPDVVKNFHLWQAALIQTIQNLADECEESTLSPLKAQAAIRELKETWPSVDMVAILPDREIAADAAGGADVVADVAPRTREPSTQSSSSMRFPGFRDFQRTATPLTFFLSRALFKLSSLPAGGSTGISLGNSRALGNYAESLRLLLQLDSPEDRSSGAILIAGYLRLMQQHLDAMTKIIRASKGSKGVLESNAVVQRSISYLSAQIPTGSEGRHLLADSAEPRTLILRAGKKSETITV